MSSLGHLSFSFLLVMTLFLTHTRAATFEVSNQCPFLVGDVDSIDTINMSLGTKQACIWTRTKCTFNAVVRGRCEIRDYVGLLQCNALGTPPNTLAEYALKQFNNLDFFDISLVDGFNVPMAFGPKTTGRCRGIRCVADINGTARESCEKIHARFSRPINTIATLEAVNPPIILDVPRCLKN